MLGIHALRNRKLMELPSDRARVAWLDLLLEAKTQKPEGTFASMNHVRMAAKHRRETVTALIDAGLLHPAEAMCERCRKRFGEVPPKSMVVHDWQDYQEPSRWTKWRDAKDAPPPAPADAPPVAPDLHPQLHPPLHPSSRERAGASLSLSSSSGSPEGIQGEPDELPGVIRWLAERRIAVIEGTRPHTDLARLVDQHGGPAVVEAMAGLPGPLHDGPQYVYGARNELNPIPSRQTTKAKGYGPTREEANRAFKTA